MEKVCSNCSGLMQLTLRTIKFNKHEIANVPIHTCPVCDCNEVSDRVKPVLKQLVHSLSNSSHERQKIAFEEYSEYTNLLIKAARDEEEAIEEIIQDRINQLLDLMLLAKSLRDQQWVDELSFRIKEVI
jgi:hypothetical protein